MAENKTDKDDDHVTRMEENKSDNDDVKKVEENRNDNDKDDGSDGDVKTEESRRDKAEEEEKPREEEVRFLDGLSVTGYSSVVLGRWVHSLMGF